jgi:hypothetical protein
MLSVCDWIITLQGCRIYCPPVMPENDVTEAVKILVKEFIPLKVNDLQEWQRNPEQWVNDEDSENDQWEYELRVRVQPYRYSGLH